MQKGITVSRRRVGPETVDEVTLLDTGFDKLGLEFVMGEDGVGYSLEVLTVLE